MYDQLYKFVILTMAGASVWLISLAVFRSTIWFEQQKKKRVGRQMVEAASKAGPRIYYNEIGKVLGVCRVSDFMAALEKRTDEPKHPWQPLRQVRVKPTFVFCRDGSLLSKMHLEIGEDDFRTEFQEALVENVTGFSRKSVDKQSYFDSSKLLIRENTRLFVPFSKNLSDEEAEEQYNFYGDTPRPDLAYKYLLK